MKHVSLFMKNTCEISCGIAMERIELHSAGGRDNEEDISSKLSLKNQLRLWNYKHMPIHTDTHVHTCTHTHPFTHVHTHIHAHIYACAYII